MEEYARLFSDASDWFYVAAVWRVEDMTAVLDENPGHMPERGHVFAIETCVRMARFARGLAAARAAGTVVPCPVKDGPVEAKVRRGEAPTQRNIDRVLASLGRAAPSNRDVVRHSAADLQRLTADGRA